MKKRLLAILPITFLFCSCSLQDFSIFGWKPFGQKNDDEHEQSSPIDDVPVDEGTHISTITADPSAPFSMILETERVIKVTTSPGISSLPEQERLFTWKVTSGDGVEIDEAEKSNQITVRAVKASSNNLITVTNDYKPSLTKTFTISVVEVGENDFFWQYQSADRAQFGYTTETKTGVDEGDAILNGVTWHFTRSETTSLQSAKGSIGFGKGSAPETHVHLETTSERAPNKILIEAASAKSLGTLQVKVNGVTCIDQNVPEDSNGVFKRFDSGEITAGSGKIELDFLTPAYGESRIEDITYNPPGAFYLKSILIGFNEALPGKTLSLVKNKADIVSGGRYLIVGSSAAGYAYLDGALSSGAKDNPHILDEFTLPDSFEMPNEFPLSGFVASINENEKLDFRSDSGLTIGLTSGSTSSLSVTKGTDKLLGWNYELDSENHLFMSMTDNSSAVKYFGPNKDNGKFSAYAASTYLKNGRIYLYKFAE